MTTHRTPMRTTARIAATLLALTMMWLPGVARAEAPADNPGFTDTTLPLLGSNLVIAITTDGNGTVTSVTVDGQTVDFAQDDDEVTFLYTVEGVEQVITIEVDNRDGNDQGDEADDDQGDEADDNQGDEADDNQGDEADDNHHGDQGEDDQSDQGDDDLGEDS